jgi:DNA-binding beta-propeller fold protein YncE
VGVLDAATGKKVLDIRTEAHPGAILVDGPRDRVFVVVPDTARVLVLDAKTHAITQNWTVSSAARTVSLALDEAPHRLFMGTRTPPRIVVLDSESGQEVASMPTVGTLDGLFFDAASKRLYASGGEGFIDVHQQVDADHYEPVAHIPTGPTARTSLFVPQWKRLFVAVPRVADRPAEIRAYEVRP